ISVPIVGDTVREDTESFSVTLSNQIRATLRRATATGRILDDERARLVVQPWSSPPGGSTSPSATGFTPGELVDLYLDSTDVRLLVAGSSGAFTASLPVPASA